MLNKFLKSCAFMAMAISVYAQNPIVKVDFDQAGRSTSEVNQVGYATWVVASGISSNLTENGVTFTVTKIGTKGDELGTNWYKAGIQASDDGKLVNDGVTVKSGTADEGGQIELRISGLAAGEHTLMMFLNAVDSPDGNTFSPIDISVDDTLVMDNVEPTVRAANSAEAKSVYLEFQAQTDTDVVIVFAAETSGSENKKNVMLNGFELNTPNIFFQATAPIPAHNDEHVVLDSGNTTLQWTAAESAVSHNVYFGTDLSQVEAADTGSALFKGNQAGTSYQVNSLYTGETYYWRIDEVYGDSSVETGSVWRFRPGQLAFPEAEGYGRFARGGRGGKVVAVTNLNDSGPGSLREAITNDIGPRTIVFNVSGIIQLSSRLVLSQPYITVAGQTAPGKGICIRSAPFGVTGNDAVVQHIRVRIGGGITYDGMGLTGADHSIIDHCSISWTIDESFSSRSGKNITLQRTLISEALNAAGHENYPVGTEHGYAATIGGDIGSFHHNLLAHNYGRNWSLGGGLDGNGAYAGQLDITNNVVYNWGSRATDGGAKAVNFVNNYYKPGAGTTYFYALNAQNEAAGTGEQQYYFAGNVMPGYFDESNQEQGRIATGEPVTFENFVDTPFFPSYVTTQSAKDAYKIVLSDVGCSQPVFDDHDQRIITETLNGTYTYSGSVTGKPGFPDDEADVGGFETYQELNRPASWDSDNDGLPDWWEQQTGTSVNSAANDFSDANADTDEDGYTNLDDYLQWMSQPHYSTATGDMISVNIQQLSRGFTSGVTYSIVEVVNGNANLVSNMVEFTPNAVGFCAFSFKVTDAEGASMIRKVNIFNGYDLSLSAKTQNVTDATINVWPIPNNGTFSIRTKNVNARSAFKVFDILGREIITGVIEDNATRTFEIPSKGLFILKITDPKTKAVLHSQKVLVE